MEFQVKMCISHAGAYKQCFYLNKSVTRVRLVDERTNTTLKSTLLMANNKKY